jgi:hypothetical protein
VKGISGKIHTEGSISATRLDLDHWMRKLPQPWSAAMEATMFTGWIYDHLKPHAAALKVAHPAGATCYRRQEKERPHGRRTTESLLIAINRLL